MIILRKIDRLDKKCDELIDKFHEDEVEWEAFRSINPSKWRINQLGKLLDGISQVIKVHREIEDYYYDHPEEIESGTSWNLDHEIQPWVDKRENYKQMKNMEEFPEEKKEKEFTDEEEDRWFREMGEHE